MILRSILTFVLCILLVSCIHKSGNVTNNDKPWGTVEGKQIHLVTLTNANGMIVKITNYGGIIVSITVPDKQSKFENVVLGFDSLDGYVGKNPYFGALIGRFGNRIAKGKFMLDGKEYSLAINNTPNHLHGGVKGFDKQIWEINNLSSNSNSSTLSLSYLSKDMEEGYPGNLKVKVNYILTNDNEIKITYEAETDKNTVINLTNHSYFNLTGCKKNILNHQITIFSDSITPTDSTLIPTGIVTAVSGTNFDFTKAHTIGERINGVMGGYDINYVLLKKGNELTKAAEVYEPVSGRVMEVYTTEPGTQFYSGNFLDGSNIGHNGIKYEQHYAFCLESQHFPNSPNQPNFPSVILKPGEKYSQLTVYKFSTKL